MVSETNLMGNQREEESNLEIENQKTEEEACIHEEKISENEKDELKRIRERINENNETRAFEFSADMAQKLVLLFEKEDSNIADNWELIDHLRSIIGEFISDNKSMPKTLDLLSISADRSGKVSMYKICPNGKTYTIDLQFNPGDIGKPESDKNKMVSVAVKIESSYN